jgi:LytS/YehU family sensor histidine kinase
MFILTHAAHTLCGMHLSWHRDSHPFIKITLNMEDGQLQFSVSNNYNRSGGSKDESSGIGLSNVNNRLDLLYTNKYNLSIRDDGKVYTVNLKLELS